MQTILQILKVNERRSGVKNDREWVMQSAECVLLNDDGSVGEVGVCDLPKELIDKTGAGLYTASFSLAANKSREGQRRIEARLINLVPLPAEYFKQPKQAAKA